LYTAIFSNTLNFNSTVTHERDRRAFAELSKLVKLPTNWVEIYFRELEDESIKDPESSLVHDIKTDTLPGFEKPLFIGQLELWTSQDFVLKNQALIKKILEAKGSPFWFFTSPSISEGHNYFFAENDKIKNLLTTLIGVQFKDNIGTTSNLILRKEILKKMHQ